LDKSRLSDEQQINARPATVIAGCNVVLKIRSVSEQFIQTEQVQ
jgi:hypothetical protein